MSNNSYLATIPDSVVMTPEIFTSLMRRYKHHTGITYGFSTKHTADIQNFRKSVGLRKNETSIPSNLYSLPVVYDTEVTYVK